MRGLAGMLAVAALAVLAVPTRALADESLFASGSITYTWQGDPALGCAAVGVCDVSGALIVQAQGSGSVTRLARKVQVLNLDDATATVRVLTGTGSTASECVDVPPGVGGPGLFVKRGPGGQLRANFDPGLSSGRCAGPLAADLDRLSLPVRKRGGKLASFDLRTSRAFTAGPYSGHLISTVRMRPDRTKLNLGQSFTSGSSGSGPPRARKLLLEHATLRYRVRLLPSTLDVSFAGAPDALCSGLGSCADHGELSLALSGAPRMLTLDASRLVKRPVSARQVIEDLRRGRLGPPLGELATGDEALTTRVSETLVRGDGSRCQSTTQERQTRILFGGGPPARSRRAAPVLLTDTPESATWRTYCPGPTDSDMFGNQGLLARVSVPIPQLLRHQSVVSLADAGTFSAYGYDGSRSGALKLSLTLVRVHAGTSRVAS